MTAAASYRAMSQINALNQLLSKFTVVTQDTPPPQEGGEPGLIITRLTISWYNDFQFGELISLLQNPNDNSDFTDRLAILSTTDYVYYVLDCISNVRGRAQTHDACNIILNKAPGIVEY